MTPIGAALAASVLTGAVALWFRRGEFAHFSGLLFALATFLAWASWGPSTLSSASLSIVIGLALAAAFWQAIALPGLRLDVDGLRWPGAPFSPMATTAALDLLALVVAAAVAGDAFAEPGIITGLLGWAAAVAVGLALAAALGEASNRLARPGLYLLGLVVVGLVLHALRLSPARLSWAAALALAIHAGAASLVVWWLQPPDEEPDDGRQMRYLWRNENGRGSCRRRRRSRQSQRS